MTGTSTWATISGTAAAAASLFTVTRTSSLPAACSARTCVAVATGSAVSVFVIDWTTIGWVPPTFTPPTSTTAVGRRWELVTSGIYDRVEAPGARAHTLLEQLLPHPHRQDEGLEDHLPHARCDEARVRALRRHAEPELRLRKQRVDILQERARDGIEDAHGARDRFRRNRQPRGARVVGARRS